VKNVSDFIGDHNLRASDIDMNGLVKLFTDDMVSGLDGKVGALRMIPTYIEPENDFLTGIPVLAIDAGGTNFRASIVIISGSGRIEIKDTVSYLMPGLEREISSREFFKTIADYVRPLAEKTDRIGLCFSYPTEIMPDRDGRLIKFCKEVQAPDVHGRMIGKNLLETLKAPHKKIVMLNDTVATLLAGKSATIGKSYESFIGYILGTGTNTCYIETNRNILKKSGLNPERSQIINIESGDFGRAPRTDLDILFDSTTTDPGSYKFEKMFSGAYFGRLVLFVLKSAAAKGVFSKPTAMAISKITDLQTEDANSFAASQLAKGNILTEAIRDNNDSESCRYIIDTLIDRAAILVAANMSAVILKCGKGKSTEKPILITVEGTTFYELYNFRSRFETYLNEYLNGDRKRYVVFTQVDQSGMIGAALAALIS
jgi:hexokinase